MDVQSMILRKVTKVFPKIIWIPEYQLVLLLLKEGELEANQESCEA